MVEEGGKDKRKSAKDFLEKWAQAEREERPAEEALKEVQAALESSNTIPGLWFRKGLLLSELEKWDLALESLRKAESLDPALPRLQVALSFVLGKLGRLQEAADANQRAIHAGAGAPEEEATVEQALKVLAEELREVAEAEVAEAQAVEGLEELVPLAKADSAEGTPEQTPEERIAEWEAAGYDVTPLREVLRKDPDRVRTALFQFEQNLPKVQLLEETVKALDPAGLEADILRVRTLLRSPFHIWRIEAEVETLLEKADARDRTVRAMRVPAPTSHPPAASRPQGAINGLAKGRVNGLVNGVQRARAGMTNGLTNGLGMTNGLGSRRFQVEARMRRWRLFLVPITAALLLSVPLFVPPAETFPDGSGIDGLFDDWRGMPAYVQATTAANADVDLRGYSLRWQDNRLSVYANVSGRWFAHPTRVDLMHVFVDGDGDRSTGYDEGRIGADLLLEVHGVDKEILGRNAWSWTGTDRDNWTAWQVLGASPAAEVSGSELELQIDLTGVHGFDANQTAIVIHTDDQQGSRASSQVAFGPTYGALDVRQVAFAGTVPQAANADFVTLTFLAVGSPVNVTGLTFDRGVATPDLRDNFLPLALSPGQSRTVTLSVDASGLANSTLLTADLVAVAANRTVAISGPPARAYVGRAPSGWIVDGLFAEWNATSVDVDRVANPNVDIERFSSESANGTAYVYAEVRGTAVGGTIDPTVRARPLPGPGVQSTPPAPPGTPQRQVGEDVVRVFFDTNATVGGTAVGGIVADAMLEIRGRNGRVRSVHASVWQPDRWLRAGTAEAIAAGSELEGSLALPGVDLRGAEYVVETRDWRGPADSTAVQGVRGTRSSARGISFVRGYEATLPRHADGDVTFAVPRRGFVSWQLPEFRVIRGGEETLLASPGAAAAEIGYAGAAYRNAYVGLNAAVVYDADGSQLKESVTIFTPPPVGADGTLVVEALLSGYDNLLVNVMGELSGGGLLVQGSFVLMDGRGLSIAMPAPWAEDASGRRIDLSYRWRDGALAVLVPGSWLAVSRYPVLIDPTTTYQLENDGPSEDAGENLGYSVAIGDFNDDGYADLLTGAPSNNLDGNFHGYAYVFFGPLTADDATPDVWIKGTTNGARHGYSVAAGKFNDDAFWDALIASRSVSTFLGNVSIYYGSASWSGLEQTPDVNFTYPSGPQNFGWWVAAGNIDNANRDEVLIGEPGRDNDGDLLPDGVVHVYKSPFSSPESTADFTLKPSTNAGSQFGHSIAVAKIDSDVYADVVVGEPFYNTNSGRIHFFKGSNMTSGSGDKLPEATLDAQASGEKFGFSVAVGTINSDSYADVAVGAPERTNKTGGAYVFLANSDGTGLTTGATPDATIAGQSSTEEFGSSLTVVDLDDDGTSGVLAGAPKADVNGPDRGRAYWFDAPTIDQTVDETLTGTQDGERLGISVAGGRFASDARTLIAIGAYLWDEGVGDNSGRVLLADVPEPAAVLTAVTVVVILGARSLQRRRLVRKR